MRRIRTPNKALATLAVLAAVLTATTAVAAAQKKRDTTSTREAFFRCKDSNGQTHYGDSMPPECVGVDTEVLNDHGMTLRIIEGTQARTARQAREAVEKKAQQERDQRAMRDRMLLETYLTVEDIERLRDQRLDLLTAQYRGTEQNIINLRERQGRLQTQIARFKPYSDKPDAPPLPDHLAEEMVNTVNGMRVYQGSLAKIRAEQDEVKTSFGSDIRRFKELKGIR